MVDVTVENYEKILPECVAHIQNSDFVAIDLEFTGLSTRKMWKDTQYDTAETRYMTKRESAKHFSVNQFGVSTFRFQESKKSFETTAYTFQIFPRGKRQEKSCGVFSAQASSLEFLSKNGFDFNKWVKKGIPYLRPAEQEKMTEMLLNKRQKQSEDKNAEDIEITDSRDLGFVNAAKVQIESWIASADAGGAKKNKHDYMTLEPCNSYLRKILRQELPKHFTNLSVNVCDEDNEDMIDRGSRWRRVRVTRYDSKDAMSLAKEQEEALKLQKDREEIRRAVGFRFVIDALRAKPAHVPLIVHNGLLDLLHTIEKFVSPLPDSFVDASRTIQRSFGTIFDTKLLLDTGRQVRGALPPRCSRLEDAVDVVLTSSFQKRGRGGKTATAPRFVWAKDHSMYSSSNRTTTSSGKEHSDENENEESGQYHEAGYDAYKTGQVFAGVLYFVAGPPKSRQELRAALASCEPAPLAKFANKIPLYRMDVPLSLTVPLSTLFGSRSHVLFVTNFPSYALTRHFVDLLSPYDSQGRSPGRSKTPNVTWASERMVLVGMADEISAARAHEAWKMERSGHEDTETETDTDADSTTSREAGEKMDEESPSSPLKLSFSDMTIAPYAAYEQMCGLNESNRIRRDSTGDRKRRREDDDLGDDKELKNELKRARSCVVS